jgi:hypothetical protein
MRRSCKCVASCSLSRVKSLAARLSQAFCYHVFRNYLPQPPFNFICNETKFMKTLSGKGQDWSCLIWIDLTKYGAVSMPVLNKLMEAESTVARVRLVGEHLTQRAPAHICGFGSFCVLFVFALFYSW